jgi:hypothetical protein
VREVEADGDVIYTKPDGTPGGGYDAGADATIVIGTDWISTLWHGWGPFGFDLDIQPLPVPAPAPVPAPPAPAAPGAAIDPPLDPEAQAELDAFDEYLRGLEQAEAEGGRLGGDDRYETPTTVPTLPPDEGGRLGGDDRYETPRTIPTLPDQQSSVDVEPEPVAVVADVRLVPSRGDLVIDFADGVQPLPELDLHDGDVIELSMPGIEVRDSVSLTTDTIPFGAVDAALPQLGSLPAFELEASTTIDVPDPSGADLLAGF